MSVVALALLGGLAFFFLVVPSLVERAMNRKLLSGPYATSARARELHRRLFVADLHADPLLWGRDLRGRSSRGHVDVPRLQEGGVALQVFSVVSKTPWGLNIQRNDDRSDQVTLLALAQGWAPKTWTSLKERAVYQARRLFRMAALSRGKLVVLKSRGDLSSFLEKRRQDPSLVAGLLALEGAQVLEGQAANVEAMDVAGYRMVGLAHFFDNEVAGSAHGVTKGGLTPMGREVVHRLEEKAMLVDLAHSSPRTFEEVVAAARRPVVVSHTGVRGTCDNVRNLSDEQLRGVARTGGVVGIGFWDTAVCGTDVQAIVRALRYAVGVAGIEHVALGSDFDGAVTTPFDASGLPLLTEALLADGFGEAEIAAVMGGNVRRLLEQTLP
ncbi:MAG TPA: membrane dipeptidase [Vicinamibacteria bacterium]